jgi:hypothetical protein
MPEPDDPTIEDVVEEFLQDAVDAADEDDTLHGAEVRDDWQTITKDFGYIVGDCIANPAPIPGGEMGEFDALLIVVSFARVVGQDKTERKAARRKARALYLRAAKMLGLNPQMNSTVRDSRILRCRRGFDSISSADVYAVVHMPLIVNETGQQVDEEGRVYE